MEWVEIGVGGLAGTMLRYGVSEISKCLFNKDSRYGMYLTNCLGCFISSILCESKHISTLVSVGFCGSLTTFGGFMNLLVESQLKGKVWLIFVEFIVMNCLCFGCYYAGTVVSRKRLNDDEE